MCWVFQSWLILLLSEGQCPDDPRSGNLTDRPAEVLSLQWVHIYLMFLSSVHFPTLNSAWCPPIQRSSVLLSSGKIVLATVIVGSSRMECRRGSRDSFYCCCSVAKLCPALCNPTGCSTPDFLGLNCFSGVCSSSRPLSGWCHPHFIFCLISISVSFTIIFRENSKSLTSETFEHSVVTYQVASWLSQLLVYNLLSRVPRLPWWFRR